MLEVYQIWLGNEEIPPYPQQIKEMYPDNYTLVTEEPYPGLPYFVQSNLLRLERAIETPRLFYLDTDIELLSKPEFDGPGAFTGGVMDTVSIFYVNGDTKPFLEALIAYKRDLYRRLTIDPMPFRRSNIISKRHYKHYHMTNGVS